MLSRTHLVLNACRPSTLLKTARTATPLMTQKAFASNLVVFHGPESDLDKIINEDGLKVLYFTASWCPPCKMIAPAFQKLSEEYQAIKFVKIDIDEFGDTASSFSIRSVPTFIFLNGTDIKSQFSGANEATLRANLAALK
eukprot:gene4423-4846_t